MDLMQPIIEITKEIRDDQTILFFKGDVVSDTEEELGKVYQEIPKEAKKKIIIDLSQSNYINSAGIAALIGMLNRVSEEGGSLKLTGLNRHFRKILDTVGLTDYIPVFETIEEALKAK